FSLLFGRFALPVAALLSGGLFVAAAVRGVKDTRCFFRWPWLAGGIWLVVVSLWLWIELSPRAPAWLQWLHR
ncbi:MAG: hypothetical protein ABUL49_01165, partial [bacterium]